MPCLKIEKRHLLLAPLLLALLPAGAMSTCPPPGQNILIACTTCYGKQVQVCDAVRTIGYTFGRPGRAPELTLNVPRQQASTSHWPGAGRTTTYWVSLPNGNATYTVYSTFELLADTLDFQQGIQVEIRGQHALARARPDRQPRRRGPAAG